MARVYAKPVVRGADKCPVMQRTSPAGSAEIRLNLAAIDLARAMHSGVQKLIRDLNRVYSFRRTLWEADGEPEGFEWIDVDNAMENIVAFSRKSRNGGSELICVGNFSAVQKKGYRLGMPGPGKYKLLINTDAEVYSGSSTVRMESFEAEKVSAVGKEFSVELDLPALATLWFERVE